MSDIDSRLVKAITDMTATLEMWAGIATMPELKASQQLFIDLLHDCRAELSTLQAALEQATKERDEALTPHMAAGLLTVLKAECEKQHERAEKAEAALAQVQGERAWQPIETAPKDGPVEDVELLYVRPDGKPMALSGHWAYGDGDGMMPPFGPAWFRPCGNSFVEIDGEPTHWRPINPPPKPTPEREES